MSVDFSKFDQMVNQDELNKQIENASQSEYDDVPKGNYICSIEKMEVKPTKAGDKLMFSVSMKIKENLSGEGQVGRWIFFNRVICGNRPNAKGTWNDGVAIKGVMSWLEKLDPPYDVVFNGYQDFSDLVLDIFQDISKSIEVSVQYDGDAFNSITIERVYDI